MKKICTRTAIALLGVISYYSLMWLLSWTFLELLDFSVSTADFRSLLIIIAVKLIPLIAAFTLVVWLWQKTSHIRQPRSLRYDSRDDDKTKKQE